MSSSFIHDTVKIRLIQRGYLPNYPYHLISDSEMADAFLSSGVCYFYDEYPLLDDNLSVQYKELVESIQYHLDILKNSDDGTMLLPDWIYSYMLGSTISVNSSIDDIHDLLVMLNVDNIDDVFTPIAQKSCYEVSKAWLRKLPASELDHRPPSLFGEPHVLKSLRLQSVSLSR